MSWGPGRIWRVRVLRTVVPAILTAVVLATPVAAAPAGHSGSPGAPGVGDPYFPDAGNGGYDVKHYDLDLAWEPASGRLDGTATIEAKATQKLSSFNLDLRVLAVTSVRVDGRPATVSQAGQELTITPPKPLQSKRTFTVEVVYGGVPETVIDPDGAVDGWIPTDDGVFVANEPQGAPSWFPVNDHPTDKATYTVSMTVPDGLTAVGNGLLSEQSSADGQSTFVWDEKRPMASYLSTITIGNFEVTESVTPDGIPIYNAVDPREAEASAPVLARIPEILAYQQSVFGKYPFENAGSIVDQAPQVGYALETQTKPVYDGAPSLSTVVHELAHQWYGDSVSPESWVDIWLNEGFAVYAEWLWNEYDGGPTTQAQFDASYATPAEETDFWNPPPGNPGSGAEIFAGSIYERGAMALQALRVKIGDEPFFRLLRSWATQNRYGNVSTSDLIKLAERVSHQQLDDFFTTWLYTEGKPVTW